MSVIAEVIKLGQNGGISFGDYKSEEKKKVNDFDVKGDIYKVKTHSEITRVEKNSKLLFEAVPGCAVHDFYLNDRLVKFFAEGYGDTQITLELEPEVEYRIVVDSINAGDSKSNRSGKINFSLELNSNRQEIKVEKIHP